MNNVIDYYNSLPDNLKTGWSIIAILVVFIALSTYVYGFNKNRKRP